MKYIETSSVDGSNIEEAFVTLAEEVHEVASRSQITGNGLWEGIQKGHRVSIIQLRGLKESKEKENCC